MSLIWGRVYWNDYVLYMCLWLCFSCFCNYLQASIIVGKFDVDDPSIRCQIIGSNLTYDVVNCRMVSNI